jgi:signal transduction histidine kinase
VVDPRWRTALAVTTFLVLGLLTAFTLGIRWGEWPHLVPELVLCAAYAGWVLAFRPFRAEWTGRGPLVGVFVGGAIALNLALVLFDGWFGFLAIATFTFSYALVPWPWELAAVGATAVVAGIAQSSSFSRASLLGWAEVAAVIAVNVVIMCGMSWGLQIADRATQRAGAEAERSRLAREIHDTLAQGFAGIVTQLQAAEQTDDDGSRRRHTEAALTLARDGLAEARRSMQALRPVALDVARLPEAVANVARGWSERTGIPIHLHTDGQERTLPTDAEVALLRTAQEALANVERHADAHRVDLSLRYEAHGARVEIRDDGRGFDLDAPVDRRRSGGGDDGGFGSGFGLVAMRERIEALAGDLVVESRSGHGTTVRAEVPA